MAYVKFKNFGLPDENPINSPLARCSLNLLDQGFQYGGTGRTYGKDAPNCQLYMSQRCAANWDKFCEVDSLQGDPSAYGVANGVFGLGIDQKLNRGEILTRNTAYQKYLVGMKNAVKKQIPFDPVLANSVKLTVWESPAGLQKLPIFRIDPASATSDPVLMKLLQKPSIAPDILSGLYATAKKEGSLGEFSGTLLGAWFDANRQLLEMSYATN